MTAHVIAGLSGFFMKIYDDIVDNPDVYSNLHANKLVLEIVMIACVVYFAHLDSVAMIACIFTAFVDILIYVYNLYYPVLNINYAIDRPAWILGILLIMVLFIYKGASTFSSFTYTEYCIILLGFGIIFIDAISLISKQKDIMEDPFANLVHLEASDRKLVLRIFALCGSVLGALLIQIIPLFYEYCSILQYIFTWGITYFLTSSMSILYLKNQYKQEDIMAATKKRLAETQVSETHKKIEDDKDD